MSTETPVRDRILDTADQLFYQRGLHAVGIDEIVDRSGAAKTTLYAHFKSKDLLIARYLQRRSDDWRVYLEAELEAFEGSAREKIDRIFQILAGGCAEPAFRGCPFINFAVEYPDRVHPGWQVCLEHRRWFHGLLAGIATEGGAPDPAGLADQLCLLYDAAMVGSMFDETGQCGRVVRSTAAALVTSAMP
jgi:AcrR family transcriptional regulator